ncbi:MAG: beta-ketoacyl synthase N-terminal-like domain-containing protein [Myxococcaceae bacterium]
MPAAITSVGAVTGHGLGTAPLISAVLEGRTAIKRVTRFSTEGLCSTLAAEAPELEEGTAPRATQLLLAAAKEALDGARVPGAKRGVVVGTTKGELERHLEDWKAGRPTKHDALNAPALALATFCRANGPVRTVGAACASSSAALGQALAWIEEGVCDEVVVGGCEGLHPFVYWGFHSLKALSPLPAAPFDAARSGLSLGEGAGVLVLESADRAKRSGRPVIAWLEGFGTAADGHDQTAPEPNGAGLLAACRQALADAERPAGTIGRYHAHGTATTHNDRMEAAAYATLFEGAPPPLFGAKGSVGHTLGAAGALDTIICALTLAEGVIPPVANLRTNDPALKVYPVQGGPRKDPIRTALLATAGFGGINTALVLAAEGAQR